MKKISILLMLFVTCLGNDGGPKQYPLDKDAACMMTMYYHWSNDFNDADIKVFMNFSGKALTVLVDPNGTDPNRSLLVIIDPPEVNEVPVAKGYTIATIPLNTASDYNIYVITSPGMDNNLYGSAPFCGDVYLGLRDTRADANDANKINSLKAWVFGEIR